jgi:hypothetical protein
MSQSMQQGGMESGVRKHHLGPGLSGRVASNNGINFLAKVLEHRTTRHDMIRPPIGFESRRVSYPIISETLVKDSSILFFAHKPIKLNLSPRLGFTEAERGTLSRSPCRM